jgi:predicted outer membrane repeat protein
VTGATGPTGAAATVEPCLVEDANSGRLFANLQAAVNAAGEGDTLNVQGTCEGDTVIYGKDLTLQGQGAGATLNGEDRSGSVLDVYFSIVSISGLTITGGNTPDVGGGIYGEGAVVTLTNSTVTGNRAEGNRGGGIYANGELTLTNSTVSDNTAGYGGGIYNEGQATLTDSTVSGNMATVANGGGILNRTGSLTLRGSSVRGNTASANGGGINLRAGSAHIEENSSVTGNTAGLEGGGIFNSLVTNTLTVENPEEVSGNKPENGY